MYALPTFSEVGWVAVVDVVELDALLLDDELFEPHAAASSGNAPRVVAPRAARRISVRRSNRGASSCAERGSTSSSISPAPRAMPDASRPSAPISTALGVASTW